MRSASWGPYVNSSPQLLSLHPLLPLGRESASRLLSRMEGACLAIWKVEVSESRSPYGC